MLVWQLKDMEEEMHFGHYPVWSHDYGDASQAMAQDIWLYRSYGVNLTQKYKLVFTKDLKVSGCDG